MDHFIAVLKTPEMQDKVPVNKQELLYNRALKAKKGPGTMTFQDFVDVVSFRFFFILSLNLKHVPIQKLHQ